MKNSHTLNIFVSALFLITAVSFFTKSTALHFLIACSWIIVLGSAVLHFLRISFSINKWNSTTGVLEKVQHHNSYDGLENSRTYSLEVQYSYLINNHIYKNNVIGFSSTLYNSSSKASFDKFSSKFKQGQNVKVMFNPSNPQESCLESGKPYLGVLVSLIFFSISAFCLFLLCR